MPVSKLGTKSWRVPLPDGTTVVVRTPHGWSSTRARRMAVKAFNEGKLPEPGERPAPEPEQVAPEVLRAMEHLEGRLSEPAPVGAD